VLEYTAATALYQEVTMLNRYVTDAALRSGYTPYVIRIQMQVTPFARHQPYDVYANIAFFPESYKFKDECPDTVPTSEKGMARYTKAKVLPLLATDNLEGLLKSRTTDVIRQFALALSVANTGLTGQGSLARTREELNSVLGSDLNSLFTVGRVTDNTISVRLGAAQEATGKYAMIPRTHNITLVLMVKNELSKLSNKKRIVRVVSQWQARDAESGKLLIPSPAELPREEGERVLQHFLPTAALYSIPVKCNKWDLSDECTQDEKLDEAIRRLHNNIYENDFAGFEKVLSEAEWTGTTHHRDLWLGMIRAFDGSATAGARFELPLHNESILPEADAQSVLLIDDGKKQMTTQLKGGRALDPSRLSAHLNLMIDTDTVAWRATSVTVSSIGSDPKLVFPSIKAWKVGPLKKNGTKLQGATLSLVYAGDPRWGGGKAGPVVFPNVFYRPVTVTATPVFSIRKTVDMIRPDAAHKATIKLFVDFKKDTKKKPIAAAVEITVSGAEIEKVVAMPGGVLTSKLGKFTVTADAQVEVTLRHLDSTIKVKVKGVAKDAKKKPIAGTHGTLVFKVKPIASTPKKN
jgi:hypothetical protein